MCCTRIRAAWRKLSVGVVLLATLQQPPALAQNPFAGNEDPLQEIRANREAYRLYNAGRSLQNRMLHSRHDGEFVEATLAALNNMVATSWARDESLAIKLLDSLASRKWMLARDMPLEKAFSRYEQEALQDKQSALAAFRNKAEEFQRVAGKPWPFDWQAARGNWLAMADYIIRAPTDGIDTASWQLLIDEDGTNADLYRIAYLVAASRASKPEVDGSIGWGLIRQDLTPEARIRRLALLCAALHDIDSAKVDWHRQQAWRKLFAGISEYKPSTRYALYDNAPLFAKMYHGANSERESYQLGEFLVDHLQPSTFNAFARAAGFSDEEIRDWFFRKKIQLDCNGRRVSAVVPDLANQVVLRISIDREVIDSAAIVTETPAEATWSELLDHALKGTSFRLHSLENNFFWIGAPARRKTFEAKLAASAAKVPRGGGKVAMALRDDTRIEFSGAPLEDVVAFLRDQHDIALEVVDGDNFTVNFHCRAPSLHIGLTILCDSFDGDWYATNELVLIGKAKTIEQFRAGEKARAQRDAKIRQMNTEAAHALRADTRMEFIETPLMDFAAYLRSIHNVPFYTACEDSDTAITANLKGVSLCVALDRVLFLTNLTWFTDGEVIYIGEQKRIDALRKLTAAREKLRASYPAAVKENLAATVVKNIGPKLGESIGQLEMLSGLQIEMPPDVEVRRRQVHFDSLGIPLDKALDLLLEPNGFRWNHDGRKITVEKKKTEEGPP